MIANQGQIQEFLAKNDTRFVIPVYQRNYDWKNEQCKQLLDDIIKVGSTEQDAHFIGSIVYIFQAEDPTGKQLEYAVFLGEKIKAASIAALYTEIIRQLFELQSETFFSTSLAHDISLTTKENSGTLRQAVALNDTWYIEVHSSSKEKFGKLKKILAVFDLEDDLIIK